MVLTISQTIPNFYSIENTTYLNINIIIIIIIIIIFNIYIYVFKYKYYKLIV